MHNNPNPHTIVDMSSVSSSSDSSAQTIIDAPLSPHMVIDMLPPLIMARGDDFNDVSTFRRTLSQFKKGRSLSDLLTVLGFTDYTYASQNAIKNYPFVVASKTVHGALPEIHSTRYLKYIMGQKMISISYAEALWIHRLGVPMKSPFAMEIESFTMAIAFGVLLPIFEQYFITDKAQVFTALLFTCLILYPLAYKLTRYAYLCKHPQQTKFPDYSLQDLISEGFKIFAILSTVLVGIDLLDVALSKASVAAGIAPTINNLFDTLTRPPEFNWTVALETIRGIFTGAAIFAPVVYVLNSLTIWCPALLPYTLLINPALIFGSIMSYGKLIGYLSHALSDYCYNFSNDEAPTLIRSYGPEIPANLSNTRLITGGASRGAETFPNDDDSEYASLLRHSSHEASGILRFSGFSNSSEA